MFEKSVMPYLLSLFPREGRDSLTIRVVLMREAEVNDIVAKMDIPFDSIDWGITTTPGMNTVRFVGRGEKYPAGASYGSGRRAFRRPDARSIVRQSRGGDRTAPGKARSLPRPGGVLHRGLVSKKITDVPGASRVFRGGIVAYSNEVKRNVLDVSSEVLDSYGAVSEQTALAMARGALGLLGADVAAAVTGIAGPGGNPGQAGAYRMFRNRRRTASRTFTRILPATGRECAIFLPSTRLTESGYLYVQCNEIVSHFITDTTSGYAVRMPGAHAGGMQALYEQGTEAFRAGNYGSSELLFRKIIDSGDNAEYRDRAWYYLALSIFNQKKYKDAIFEFNRFLLICTAQDLCQESRTGIAESNYFLKNYIRAIEEFKRFIAQSRNESAYGGGTRPDRRDILSAGAIRRGGH
jgi:PncC family amidohydrolase